MSNYGEPLYKFNVIEEPEEEGTKSEDGDVEMGGSKEEKKEEGDQEEDSKTDVEMKESKTEGAEKEK